MYRLNTYTQVDGGNHYECKDALQDAIVSQEFVTSQTMVPSQWIRIAQRQSHLIVLMVFKIQEGSL